MARFVPFGGGRERYTRRLIFVSIVAGLFGLSLIARLAWLQISQAPYYTALARGNRIRVLPIAPTRGLIYDRNGRVLAENVPTYELTLTPDQAGDLAATLAQLGKIIPLSKQDLDNFHRLRATKQPFQPIPVKTDLTRQELARFAVNRQSFPGVDIEATLKRYYPANTDAEAAVGYVGLLSPADLSRLDPSEYSASSRVGKTGVEWEYEQLLHGKVGYEKVEVNAAGRTVRVLSRKAPKPGDDIYLTIDDRLQKVAFRALGDQVGAVVAIEPYTGAILCLVSKPTFNPNIFVSGISLGAYQTLLARPGDPLFNRALRGRYAPGSTIKPFLGLAALHYGVLTPSSTYFAGPTFRLPNYSHIFHNWDPYQNGYETLAQALVRSTDTFFYQLADKLGIERMHAYLSRFGFGKKPPIDLPNALPGVNPSPQWKKRTYQKPWYQGQTIINGIGQGYLLVTPLQLAWATATLAARGHRYAPHVLLGVKNPATNRRLITENDPLSPIVLPSRGDWTYVINALRQVIESPNGTAHSIAEGLDFTMAGKTGTAQVTSIYHSDFANENDIPPAQRDNGLFIAFAPVDKPQIAVAVVVEHGGSGGRAAAPIARKVVSAWLNETGSQPSGRKNVARSP